MHRVPLPRAAANVRLFTAKTSPPDGSPALGAARPPTGRDRERALLDAWREAHWSLRLKLQEVVSRFGVVDLETLYDAARRADNELNEFYQACAEVLARQLRDTGREPGATDPAPVSIAERALLARFRAVGDNDRAALLRLATRLASGTDRGLG